MRLINRTNDSPRSGSFSHRSRHRSRAIAAPRSVLSIVAEVLIESLPQSVLQGFIYIAVMKNCAEFAPPDAADEATRRLQRNASNGFDALMRRLDALFQPRAADAPADFRERLEFWSAACGLPAPLHERMHRLRVWRNASERLDSKPQGERTCPAL